jgi:hypothetical protein
MSTEKSVAVLAAHQWRGWRNEYFGDGDWRRNFQVCACGSDWSFAHQAAMLEPVIREREAAALEEAANALNYEGAGFQKSWGSNARDDGMICGIATSGNWLRARAAGIREGS